MIVEIPAPLLTWTAKILPVVGQGSPIYFTTVDIHCPVVGIELHHTTAYHPQSNGLVERFHRHLKASLRPWLTSPNWTTELSTLSILGNLYNTEGRPRMFICRVGLWCTSHIAQWFFVSHNSQLEHHSQLQQLLQDQVHMQVPMPTSKQVPMPTPNMGLYHPPCHPT